MASLNGLSELQNPISKRRLAMINMSDNGKILIQQNHTNGTSKKYKNNNKEKKNQKLRDCIYIFQTYRENNAWLHYLILLDSSMLLKHQCCCLHIQEFQPKSFVHKKDCQSLNGMIDLSTY